MANYTKVNFMDIDVASDEPGQMRFSRKLLDSKDLGMTYLKFAPNYRSKMAHHHKVQEEVYAVIAGGGRMLVDGQIEELKQWDVVRVAPEAVRAFEAGPAGLEMMIAGGPKPPEGDGQMVEADWPA